jgi:hypothetical protein
LIKYGVSSKQKKKESRAHNCEDKTKGLYEDLQGKVNNNPQSPTRNNNKRTLRPNMPSSKSKQVTKQVAEHQQATSKN